MAKNKEIEPVVKMFVYICHIQNVEKINLPFIYRPKSEYRYTINSHRPSKLYYTTIDVQSYRVFRSDWYIFSRCFSK